MVCRIKNRHTFKSMPILNSAYFKSMPILNSAYFTAWYDDMTSAFGKVCRIKNRHTFKSMPILNSAYFTECRFVIRHITQTDTETETEANFTHLSLEVYCTCRIEDTSANYEYWSVSRNEEESRVEIPRTGFLLIEIVNKLARLGKFFSLWQSHSLNNDRYFLENFWN